MLDEVEIRELLIDRVGHRCCWGSRPARAWKIHAVENCNVYVGTLETFIEEREAITEKEPYFGGTVDGKDNGRELGIWELDLKSQFPMLFIPHKETRIVIPYSEATEKCSGCGGRGNVLCPECNRDQEPGFYKEKQMMQCHVCFGRGLIAHRDGSDSICAQCDGKGNISCTTCGSRGLIKCKICQGGGSLLHRAVAIVKWLHLTPLIENCLLYLESRRKPLKWQKNMFQTRPYCFWIPRNTLSTRKVGATSGASSVPDEIFHRAKGSQLWNTQAYQCAPAFFADSYFLNKFSSEVIGERAAVPPNARVICERHVISVVPVTRVTMAHHGRSFSFYIVGFSREVYLDHYPSRFCWGLCPCFEWLKL